MNFSALNTRLSTIFSSLSRSARTVPRVRIHVGFQPEPFVVGHLPGRAGQALDEFGDLERLALDFHAAGFQADQVEQVVDELEQPHAVGVHGHQQLLRVSSIERPAESVEQRFQRREQQRQRRAQFVADVGEEAALDLVQFPELLVAFLEDARFLSSSKRRANSRKRSLL